MKTILLIIIGAILVCLSLLDVLLRSWFSRQEFRKADILRHDGTVARAELDVLEVRIKWVKAYARLAHVMGVIFILVCLLAYIFS